MTATSTPLRADEVEDVDAGHAGHRDVEEDEIGIDVADAGQPLFAARGRGDLVAPGLETRGEQPMDFGVVIDDEDSGHDAVGSRLGRGGEYARAASTF